MGPGLLFSKQHLSEDEKKSEELAWGGGALQAGNSQCKGLQIRVSLAGAEGARA